MASEVLTNSEKYHLLLWTPYEMRHYNELPQQYKDKLNAIKKHAIENYTEWYVLPGNQQSETLKDWLGTNHGRPIEIVGYSGTGKTTMIYVTLEEYRKEQERLGVTVKYEVFDMLVRGNSVVNDNAWYAWLNTHVSEKRKSRSIFSKFIGMLVSDIYRALFVEGQVPAPEEMKQLTQIVENYESVFYNESEPHRKIFREVKKYVNNTIPYQHTLDSDEESPSYVKDLKDKIFEFCTYSNELYETTKMLLSLYFMIYACSFDKDSIKSGKYKYCVVFDNIEHFIQKDIVQDFEVQELDKLLADFVEENDTKDSIFYKLLQTTDAEHVGQHEKPQGFSRFFHVVIAVRETTYIMFNRINVDTTAYANTYIDMTKGCYVSDILRKKFELYAKHDIHVFDFSSGSVENTLVKMFSDNPTDGTGLWKRVGDMYSRNIRRIVHDLIESFSGKENVLLDYHRLHDIGYAPETIEMARTAQVLPNIINTYRNAARQTIYRLMWDAIARNGELYGIIDQATELGRRLAVFLSNYNAKSFVRFSKIMEILFISMHGDKQISDISDQEINAFTQIISAMRERNRNWNWAPLIMLRYNDTDDYSTENMKGILDRIKTDSSVEMDDDRYVLFGLKLAFAGHCFAQYSNEFEYFASKYAFDTLPLYCYSSIHNRSEIEKLIRSVREKAINILYSDAEKDSAYVKLADGTYDYNALYKMKYFYDEEFDPFDESNATSRNRRLPFPVRLIRNHVGYLDNYRVFIMYNYEGLIGRVSGLLGMTATALQQLERNLLLMKLEILQREGDDAAQTNTRTLLDLVSFVDFLLSEMNLYINAYKTLTDEYTSDIFIDNRKYTQNYIGGENRNISSGDIFENKTGQYGWYRQGLNLLEMTPLTQASIRELLNATEA